MFHLMYVHYTFRSVSVAEWPPFSCPLGWPYVLNVFYLFVFFFIYLPFWFEERDLAFDLLNLLCIAFLLLLVPFASLLHNREF